MGLDSGIVRMGVLAFVFLIAFGGLISLIPSQLAYAGKQYARVGETIPEEWYGYGIAGYNFSDTEEINLTATAYLWNFDLGGNNLQLKENIDMPIHVRYLQLFHRYGFGLLGLESMNRFNRKGEEVSVIWLSGVATLFESAINEEYEEYNDIEFRVECEGEGNVLGGGSKYFWITCLMQFNHTLYDNPVEAWDNADLNLLFGINPENSNYTFDVWYLVQNILAFNTLEVFGTTDTYAYVLNGIIVAPLFASGVIFGVMIFLEIFKGWL